MELVKDLGKAERVIYQISGPLGHEMPVVSGTAKIEIGQLLKLNTTTGAVEIATATDDPYGIALSECDATTEDGSVTVCDPVTEFNIGKVIGCTETDYECIAKLRALGIILREVK